MTTAVLELNDTGISVTSNGKVLCVSPGYVLMDGKHIVSGEQARSNARLKPRKVNTRFWSQLNLEPINPATPHVKHNADLAWFHMKKIRQLIPADLNEFVFAVPGTYSKQQLGLLLGIAQECSIPVSGLVDSALAAVSSQQYGQAVRQVLYMDMQMHRITLTHVDVHNGYERGDVDVVAKFGLQTVQELYAEAIADLFVRYTRFDPMHRAQTEQSLYDVMPDWLSSLETDSVIEIQMNAGRRDYSVNLSRDFLVNAVAELYQEITAYLENLSYDKNATQIMLSHRLVQLPGFVDYLKSRLPDGNYTEIQEDSVSQGVATYEAQILKSSDAVHFITRLKTVEQTEVTDSSFSRSLFLVCKSKAYSLNDIPLYVSCMPDDGALLFDRGDTGIIDNYCLFRRTDEVVMLEIHGDVQVFANQQRILENKRLHTGDSIHVGDCGTALKLIELVD